jgi:RNA polymerase sigma-70 factor (ECF subfamily)
MGVVGSVEAAEFGQLEVFRRELIAYCYRMLASPYDAEDAVQDTLVRAWHGLGRFEDRAGLRPWLYRIATNVCLDMLKGRGRRALPMDIAPVTPGGLELGTRLPATTWIQPIPDQLVSSPESDPAEIAVTRESIRLAFIAALQYLAPRQRAVLILRDVLRWKAEEVAELLGTSVDAVNSAVRRARSALAPAELDAVPSQPAEQDRQLLDRYVDAFWRYDVDALVALLHEDATLAMPPFELWLQGRSDIRGFMLSMAVEGRDHLVSITANGFPAVALYRRLGPSGALEPHAIQVLEMADGLIRTIYAFLEPDLFPVFGLPALCEGAND